jgi:hypothetical protein
MLLNQHILKQNSLMVVCHKIPKSHYIFVFTSTSLKRHLLCYKCTDVLIIKSMILFLFVTFIDLILITCC